VAFTQDLFTSYRGYSDGNTRIGETNRLWYDKNTNTIRISDGVTPGGIIVGGGSSSTVNYPDQTNHGGDFLQTNGTTVLWAPVPAGPQGIQGPVGDTGPTGATGLKGDTGATGPKGDTGATGPKGDTGAQGIQGIKGDTGLTGATGDTGAKGDTGVSVELLGTVATEADLPAIPTNWNDYAGHGWIVTTGISPHIDGALWYWDLINGHWDYVGPIVGPQGNTGATGATGPKGDTGATGPKGDTGATGAQGIQGIQGLKGDTGNTGATGSAGPGVATGGTANQLLAKLNGTDYATQWIDPYSYTLPTASSSTLGGVKVNTGANISIDSNGFITAHELGNLSVGGPDLQTILGSITNADILITPNGTGSVGVPSLKVGTIGNVISSQLSIQSYITTYTFVSTIAYSNGNALASGTYGNINGVPAPWTVFELTPGISGTPVSTIAINDVLSGVGIVPSTVNDRGLGGPGNVWSNYVIVNLDLSGLGQIQPIAGASFNLLRPLQKPGLDVKTATGTDLVLNSQGTGDVLINTNILPVATNLSNLGSPEQRWKSVYVGPGTIFVLDETLGKDIAIGARDGLLYIQNGVGLRVGEFTLIDNQIKIANNSRDIIIGTLGATADVVFNRSINVKNSANKTAFYVSRTGLTSIYTPSSADPTTATFNIIGTANGHVQPRPTSYDGTLIQLTAQDNKSSRISSDAFGTGVYALYAARTARGTVDAPTALQSEDIISRFTGVGYGTSEYKQGIIRFDMMAAETFTNSAAGTKFTFQTTPTGSIAAQLSATINSTGLSFVNTTDNSSGITFRDGTRQTTAATNYTLPAASTTVLGGVKVDGTTITINGSGVISSVGTNADWTSTSGLSQILHKTGASGPTAIALGQNAAGNVQGTGAIAIGVGAAGSATTSQGADAIAIGTNAGGALYQAQGDATIAIGKNAGGAGFGTDGQKQWSVAIGNEAGNSNQDAFSVALGAYAGRYNQGSYATALGQAAGLQSQGQGAVAIGQAGYESQGAYAVAIGSGAGDSGQGANAIAIGNQSGGDHQIASSIIINATGSALEAKTRAGLFVAPILSATPTSNALYYNTTTKEVSYGTVTAAAGTLTGTTLNSTVVNSSLTSVGTLTSLTSAGTVIFTDTTNSANTTTGALQVRGGLGVSGNIYLGGGINCAQTIYANGFSTSTGDLTAQNLITGNTNANIFNTTATTVNFAGAATVLNIGATTGTTTVNNDLSMASGKTISTTATVTSNHATAFIAGDSAISGVALQIPREGALRNLTNGLSNMYFDVSIGGSTNGQFQFRSSSSFTNVLTMNPTAFNVNPNAVVTARTPSFGRLPWNSAIDTELTIDDYRFRVSNQGGNFPQIISNVSGQTKNSAWTAVSARSGSAIGQAGSTGNLVPNNSWVTLYNLSGMDSAGDTVTVSLQDKNLGRIYRVTFMRSDNGSTTGYNIIAERLL